MLLFIVSLYIVIVLLLLLIATVYISHTVIVFHFTYFQLLQPVEAVYSKFTIGYKIVRGFSWEPREAHSTESKLTFTQCQNHKTLITQKQLSCQCTYIHAHFTQRYDNIHIVTYCLTILILTLDAHRLLSLSSSFVLNQAQGENEMAQVTLQRFCGF